MDGVDPSTADARDLPGRNGFEVVPPEEERRDVFDIAAATCQLRHITSTGTDCDKVDLLNMVRDAFDEVDLGGEMIKGTAVSSTDARDEMITQSIFVQAMRKISNFSVGNLTEFALAVVKMGVLQSRQDVMNAIAVEAMNKIHDAQAEEITRLTRLLALASWQHKPFMTKMGTIVARSMDRYSPSQLSDIAWSFGYLSIRHAEFLTTLSETVKLSLEARQQQPRPQPDICSVHTFGAAQLSNIAFACAAASYKDTDWFQLAMSEIISNRGELSFTMLCRCAWAYRRLRVQCTKLMDAIAAEAVVKINDFTSKALVLLVDQIACYLGVRDAALQCLHDELDARTTEITNFFLKHPSPTMASKEYAEHMQQLKLTCCGATGTRVLFRQLDVPIPSHDFMRRCRRKAWLKQRDAAKPANGEETALWYAAAELNLEVASCFDDSEARGERRLCEWVVCYDGEKDEEHGVLWLAAVYLPGGYGTAAAVYAVLVRICTQLVALGVDMTCAESRKLVRGSVDMLYTQLPDLSSVGALRQFCLLFPSVTLKFVEMVSEL